MDTQRFSEIIDRLIDDMAKPAGSLGLLEKHVKKTFLAWGHLEKNFSPFHIIFSGDNGIVQSGVVRQLPQITYMQSQHMLEGTAAISCFCRCNHIPYEVVDVGIDSADAVGVDCKVRRGTRDFSVEPAMSALEFQQAVAAGRSRVQEAQRAGYDFLSFGEMGIGNTTTSAAVLKAISPQGASFVAGYGAAKGNYKVLLHKRRLIQQALATYHVHIQTAEDALRYVGGFDLAALYGAMSECQRLRIPFYIDGFITAVALACAVQMNPNVALYALPSHLSREPGMAVALRLAGLDENEAIIHADMALGEGTGAVLAVTLLRSMFYAVWHMATLSGINREAAQMAETVDQ